MKVLIHEWVTGGGLAGDPLPASWAAEGRAMRRALARDFRAVDGVDVVVTRDNRFDDREDLEGTTVLVGPGEEKSLLAHWASLCDWTLLIAPETDSLLEDRTRWVIQSGGRLLGSTPNAVALAADKERLARHFTNLGIPTPRTEVFHPRDGLPANFPYPAVVKPVDGAGSMHTFFCERPDCEPFHGDLPSKMLIQPYIEGDPLSATYLIGPDNSVVLVGSGWQTIQIRDGQFFYQGGRLPAPARFADGEVFKAVRSIEGLRGIVGVDFVRDRTTGATTVLEINPRPTTSYVGWVRRLPPGTIAQAWLDRFAGRRSGEDFRGMIAPDDETAEVIFDSDGTILGDDL